MNETLNVLDRDFNSYELGDNVYELAGGVIVAMADRAGYKLSSEPGVSNLGGLVAELGPDKVLRNNNNPSGLTLEEAADFVEQSGVQSQLARSLWTPNSPIPRYVDSFIATGGVANWQDRAASLLVEFVQQDQKIGAVYLPMGNRIMSSKSEVANPNVMHFAAKHDNTLPTEAEYGERYVEPRLVDAGLEVKMVAYPTGSGSDIATEFAKTHSELWEAGTMVSVARVANSGLQLAVQMRLAGQKVLTRFDEDKNNPQLYVLTDSLPVARTSDQVAKPSEYQSPITALRQVAVSARALVQSLDEKL